MSGGLTESLGAFIASLRSEDVPAEAVATVRRGMADCLGVALAGAAEPVALLALGTVPGNASRNVPGTASGNVPGYVAGGDSRIWTAQCRATSADAAFVNAVAAHALDFDDTGLDGHPSVVLAPVVLAEAERSGATWRTAVTAYVAGYEVWAELLSRDADKLHGKGWHPTAVYGAVACAAASARMRGLAGAQSSHALGIAASMAGGLVANFGSMTKPLQVGFAARNGILAAALAERGAGAANDVLESPRGFLPAVSPAGRVRLEGPCKAGTEWQILVQGLNVKRYPVCYAAHRIIDAALSVHFEVQPHLGDVTEVVAEIGELQAAMLRSSRPATSLDAKFSAEFTIACALLRGHVDLQDLDEARVMEAGIQQLLRKVRVVPATERDADEALFSPADRLTVRLRDGTRIDAEPVRRALGHASRPVGATELQAKFFACAARQEGTDRGAWWEAATAPLDAPVSWPGS